MKTRIAFTGLLFCAVALAGADTFVGEATHNITVQPAGPRAGNNGLNFMNVEGWINGNFSSYGIAEFQGNTFGTHTLNSPLTSARMWMLTANAAFSATGDVYIGLMRDNTVNINQAVDSPLVGMPKSPLIFDLVNAQDLTDETGINGQFTYDEVGKIPYKVADGTLFRYSVPLTLTSAQNQYIRDKVNAGQPIRFVFFNKDAVTAGTFAGYGYKLGISPNLVPTISEMLELNTGATQPLQAGLIKLPLKGVNPAAGGNFTKRSVKVEIWDSTGTTLIETAQGSKLNAQGLFTFTTSQVGDFVVKVKGQTWLAKSLGVITLTGLPQVLPEVDFAFTGDCDDNNIVNTDDYLALSSAFDTIEGDALFVEGADLDCNGLVNTDDYLLLSNDFDNVGE